MKKPYGARLGAIILTLCLLVTTLCTPVSAKDRPEWFRNEMDNDQLPPWLEPLPQWEAPGSGNARWEDTYLEIPAVDGQTLRGTMTMPANAEDPVPMAILVHGLATDKRWCDDMAMALAQAGIGSVRFDLRGTGLSDGASWDMTVDTEIEDVNTILDYVENLEETDRGNIFLAGKSLGGVVCAYVAAERESEIKALNLWYPGWCIRDASAAGFVLGQFFDGNNPPDYLDFGGYIVSKDFLESAKALNYEEEVTTYSRDVLIQHGDRDFIAPYPYSLQMAELYPSCTLSTYYGQFHGFFFVDEMRALQEMVDFFQDHID